ncbi:MAG: DUF2953 domain-containing protein, partial [bacterium]|nr:DUF2953 domain-containing protein [bacterium]
ALLSHVWLRVKKILTKVFPRKINCNLVVGTGAPDTTGYIYAVYGIILSFLRKKDTLYIEPDFEEARLEGNINAKGHFMIITFVFNGLKILFDKKLHSLRRKLKKKPVELNA